MRGRTLLALALSLLGLASLADAEVVQRGRLRVSFEGEIRPSALPRQGAAPISVRLGGRITTADRSAPPQLRRLTVAINREGRLDYAGLPACRLDEIQPATTANALRACGPSKVGEGSFSANVVIPRQSPFPSEGKVVAFNGLEDGHPVIFAHVYGTEPVPTSYTLALRIKRSKGAFGTVLSASLPEVTSDVAFVTGISLELDRRYRYRGRAHSYLAAACPAPRGFPGVVFPLARVSFAFTGGKVLGSTLIRSCRVRGR
jgi:hypothetical protein